VVNATITGIEKDAANNGVFNVGSGVATNVLEVADALMLNYNRRVPLTVTGNYRLGDIRHNYADLTRIKNILGFMPETDFMTGINQFCNWVNGQQVFQSNYDQSLDEMKQKGLFK
jgi:dTDP-L-rhamnose 4-epimerase